MKLTFSAHISAKTHRDFQLKVFPGGEPNDFLIESTETEGGEMTAWTCEYDFPDDSVVVARTEFGPAVIDPDAPLSVAIEVHIGPKASDSVIAAAEAEAKELAARAGVKEDDESIPGFTGLSVVQH